MTVLYDRARHHFTSNFPDALPIEQAYVHIGMYLGWIIENQLYSEYFEDECGTQMYRFRQGQISCTILSEIWDGHLGSEFFTHKGNLFTNYYYGGGLYRKDYETLLAVDLPSLYHVLDTPENFRRMADQISRRYAEWRQLIA